MSQSMPPRSERAGRYVLVRWAFLRLLAVTHLGAFGSLWVQVHGLVGERGIAPAAEFVAQVRQYFERGGEGFAWWKAPTLALFGAGDTALHVLCGAGVAASALLLLGVAPPLTLFALWALYLSLAQVGDVFLGYQWDALLLETTLLAVFVAPWGWWPRLRDAREPPAASIWLPRLLLFKLMFSSGVVKVNHPGEWRDLTALDYHYWTQPLPNAVAWYAQQLPGWFHRLSVAATLAVEVVAPFLVFVNPRGWRLGVFLAVAALGVGLAGGWPGPGATVFLVLTALLLDERVLRRFLPPGQRAPDEARLGAFALFAGLLLAMAVTGNYGFFHLLTFTLCVTLLDDAALCRLLPARLRPALHPRAPERPAAPGRAPAVGAAVFAAAWLPLSLLRMTSLLPAEARAREVAADAPAAQRALAAVRRAGAPVLQAVGPFRSVNGYGLFARMTTARPEVVVEGSVDGETWKPYGFAYKPVDPAEAPGFAHLHMPRLDWQLWFAGLAGDCRRARWYRGFAQRLLENDPTVLGLVRENPFGDAAPRFVRAWRRQYTFTTAEERARTGRWWAVRDDGLFCPPLDLETAKRR